MYIECNGSILQKQLAISSWLTLLKKKDLFLSLRMIYHSMAVSKRSQFSSSWNLVLGTRSPELLLNYNSVMACGYFLYALSLYMQLFLLQPRVKVLLNTLQSVFRKSIRNLLGAVGYQLFINIFHCTCSCSVSDKIVYMKYFTSVTSLTV